MKIKNICIITNEYPSDIRMAYTFLEQLVNQFADFGINCYVISPQSITRNILRKYKANKKAYTRVTDNGNEVKVYAPFYITYSGRLPKFNLFSFKKVVERKFFVLAKEVKFDVIYAHFIFPAGIVANEIGKKYNIPVFFAYGENTSYTIDYLGKEKTCELLKGVKGVISVSTENRKRLIENKIVPADLIQVFPNGVNNKVFYKKDKKEMRKKLGYSENDFIIAFVGRFVYIKGIDRLCETLNLINNNNIKAIFIGKGNIKPNYKNTIYQGTVDHKKIADYLSASDIFVLPTTAEGCCNSIIEAMACGLPIVSSNETFNDDILDENCSIRIDNMNVYEIKKAIELLYNDKEYREKLSMGALEKAKELNIEKRAKSIIEFMESFV